MQRLEDEAGISYEGLELGDINPLIARAFSQLSSFAARPEADADPAAPTSLADQRRRDALLGAVTPATAGWSGTQRRMVAAVLDLLWSRRSHERLTEVWNFDHDEAIQAVTWGIDLLLEGIRDDHRPCGEPS